MESSTSQDVHNVRDIVQQYLRDAESSPSGLEERSHLAQLCSECILLFQIILKTLPANADSVSKERKMMSISLKRSYGRMKIWADENGATDGSLDATLAASPDVRRDILKYIVSISQTLSERLINLLDINLGETGLEAISAVRSLTTAVTEGDSDSSSDSGFSDSSSCSVTGILEDLRVDTTCLQDLEPLLCSPILRTDPEPTAFLDTTRMSWNPHQPYSDKVSVRFPMAADDLVIRLGKANYERYLRCQKQKAANELRDTPPDQTASAVPDSASSKFHDSGIGSSLPTTASAYAETVMSYGMGEGRRIRVPPLPAGAKEGLLFACVACGNWVKIATNSAWKQHLYKDLEPWVCLEADCVSANDTFPTRNDWTTHLALDHGMGPEWRIIECPLCRLEIGPDKHAITRHMGEHLEEISLSALPADCEFEESDGDETDRENDSIESIESAAIKDPAFPVEPFPSIVSVAANYSDTEESPATRPLRRRAPTPEGIGPLPFESDDSDDDNSHDDGSEEYEREFASWKRTLKSKLAISDDEYNHGSETDSRPHTAAGFVDSSKEVIGGGVLTTSETRGASTTHGKRHNFANADTPSGYWSVAEMNQFEDLLSRFGTDWEAIALHMTTKTATMVRNFYTKQTGREKPEWHEIAFEADLEREIHIDQQMAAHKVPTQTTSKQDAARGLQDHDISSNRPMTASRNLENDHGAVSFQGDAGKGKKKQQARAEVEDDDLVSSSPPPSGDYFPGWTPEATFDWGIGNSGSFSSFEHYRPPMENSNAPIQHPPQLGKPQDRGESSQFPAKTSHSNMHQRESSLSWIESLEPNSLYQYPFSSLATEEIGRNQDQPGKQQHDKELESRFNQGDGDTEAYTPRTSKNIMGAETTAPRLNQSRDKPNLSTDEGTMKTTVKRSCDACHRRHVKCDGANPCRNCDTAQLGCTYHAIPEKKVPQGSRAKAISELRRLNAHRINNTCDACYRRKVKCDGTNPCRNCQRAQLGCTYHAIPQKILSTAERGRASTERRRLYADKTNNEETANIPQGANSTTEAHWMAQQQAQNMAQQDVQNMNAAMLQNNGPIKTVQDFQLMQARFSRQQQDIVRENMQSTQRPGTPTSQQQVTQGNMGMPGAEQIHPGQNLVNKGGQQGHPEKMQQIHMVPQAEMQQRMAMQTQQQIQLVTTKLYQDNLEPWLQQQQLTQETCPPELLDKFRMQCLVAAKQKVIQLREQQQHQQALAMQQQDGDEGALGASIQPATARND